MIDAVSGGALIIRSTHYAKNIVSENHTPIPKERMLKDRLYPLFTWLIRHMYASSTGKILHLLLKKMHALPNPMDVPKASCGYVLADSYAVMVRKEYAVLEDNLAHRRSIANMYASRLPKDVLISSIRDKIYRGSCLRFPVFVKDPKAAVLALAKKGIYISDTWYDSPVGPGRYLGLTDYAGQCPSSEKICRKILNLPTHINVSEVKARDICDALTAFLKQA
jgi:dTDP-4-amino-4,6-dideoxygalactose transaminase